MNLPLHTTDYQRIAAAIDYIKTHFKEQPSLEKIAAFIGLSPTYFQKLFTEWAGVSPKKFIQYLTLEYAKSLLVAQESIATTAYEAGLSGTGRLHDLFISIEGMTPGEFKQGGKELCIHYYFYSTPFGNIIIASTTKGICHLMFEDDEQKALSRLKQAFPNAHYKYATDNLQQNALRIFTQDWNQLDQIKLHLKATDFQLKVWQSLLKIPFGNLQTYGAIAMHINQPSASRAVGTAIGSNPIAFLIPCHRVIQASGNIGGYMWGTTRKSAIIGWEAAHIHKDLYGN